MKEIIRISMFYFSWLQYNVLNTKVSNLKKIFLKQGKKPEIIPVPFVCICNDTIGCVSLAYSFVV